MSRTPSSRRTGVLLLLALACAAALWTLAGGREARDATGAPSRAAEPAAAVADRAPAAPAPDAAPHPATGGGTGAAPAPPAVPPMGPLVPGSMLVESRQDGTQVLDGIPCQVRQPDGTMSSRPVRITIQPAAVVPIENGGTAPGHR